MSEPSTNRFKAVGVNASAHVICERHNAGDIAICPICDAELVVAFTWPIAQKFNAHPGVFCPKDSKHYQVLFNSGMK